MKKTWKIFSHFLSHKSSLTLLRIVNVKKAFWCLPRHLLFSPYLHPHSRLTWQFLDSKKWKHTKRQKQFEEWFLCHPYVNCEQCHVDNVLNSSNIWRKRVENRRRKGESQKFWSRKKNMWGVEEKGWEIKFKHKSSPWSSLFCVCTQIKRNLLNAFGYIQRVKKERYPSKKKGLRWVS